jgi:hypothetical protein
MRPRHRLFMSSDKPLRLFIQNGSQDQTVQQQVEYYTISSINAALGLSQDRAGGLLHEMGGLYSGLPAADVSPRV